MSNNSFKKLFHSLLCGTSTIYCYIVGVHMNTNVYMPIKGAGLASQATVSLHVLVEVYLQSFLTFGKVKLSLEQATKAQRGNRCITLLFLQPRR